jgi:hypothetical protein
MGAQEGKLGRGAGGGLGVEVIGSLFEALATLFEIAIAFMLRRPATIKGLAVFREVRYGVMFYACAMAGFVFGSVVCSGIIRIASVPSRAVHGPLLPRPVHSWRACRFGSSDMLLAPFHGA